LLHDILQTVCVNVTRFITYVQVGMEMNLLNFEIKRSRSQWD